MSRTDDVAALEAAFEYLEARMAAGETDWQEHSAALSAFYTSDPQVEAFVERWRAEFPNSLHAMAARAAMLVHLGIVVRGDRFVSKTPPNSMRLMSGYFSAAQTLLYQVLEADADYIFAANNLKTTGIWLGDRRAQALSIRLLEKHGDPLSAFWSRLNKTYTQWGGSREKTRQFCSSEAPKMPNITVEECNAVAIITSVGGDRNVERALNVLQARDPDQYFGTIFSALLKLRRGGEALAMVRKYDHWVSYTDVEALASAVGDRSLLIEFSQRWLDVNPNHPIHLQHLAEGLSAQGDSDGAIAAIDRALIHGSTIPSVRKMQVHLYWQRADKLDQMMGTIEDALDDTNWHYEVYHYISPLIGFPADELRIRSDGTPVPNFQCRRRVILSYMSDICQAWQDESAQYGEKRLARYAKIVESIDDRACE